MKCRLLATTVLAGSLLSIASAANGDVSGEWSTHPGGERDGILGQILKGLSGSQITVGNLGSGAPAPGGRFPRAPLGSFGGNDQRRLPQGGRAYQTALNAKFKIDRKRNVLSGSIEFRQPDSYTQIKTAIRPDLCKGFDIVDGVVAGNAFTFKTHITIRGVQVLTPWNGQLSATGAMVLEPLETLPCSEAPDRGFGFGPGSNAMVFHRAEPSGQAFEGKWWTREPGAIGVLELKADARSSAVTGVFENICREERKLAGTFNGKTLTLNTPANARDYGPTAWRVELIGDNTLRVAAEPPPQCMMERPVAFRLFPAG